MGEWSLLNCGKTFLSLQFFKRRSEVVQRLRRRPNLNRDHTLKKPQAIHLSYLRLDKRRWEKIDQVSTARTDHCTITTVASARKTRMSKRNFRFALFKYNYNIHLAFVNMLILEAASEVLPGIETWARCPSVVPEAQPRALREGNTRRFLSEVEPRTQLLIGLEFFHNKLFTESSRTKVQNIFVNCSWVHIKKRNQRQIAFSITWTRQEPCGSVGSSVISDPGVPGSNSTAVYSLFLCHFFFSKWGQQKISVFHMNGDGLRTCAPVKSIKTSQQYPRLRVPMSCKKKNHWAVSTFVGGYLLSC